MPTITINNKTYLLKTSFELLTFGEYRRLIINNDNSNRNALNIAVLTNMPIDLVTSISQNQLDIITPHIAFIQDINELKCESVDAELLKNISDESWLKIETAKILIKQNNDKDIVLIADKIVSIYADIDITDMLLPKAMTLVYHYANQIQSFFESFKKLNDYKPDNDEIMAGNKQLEYLDFYLTLDALTHSDITKREQVKETSAFEVYNQLLVDYEKAQYQKRLIKIRDKKK